PRTVTIKPFTLLKAFLVLMLVIIATFAWLLPPKADASTALVATAEGVFNQNPLFPPPPSHDPMYICGGSHVSTQTISSSTTDDQCLSGNDAGTVTRPQCKITRRSPIDIDY